MTTELVLLGTAGAPLPVAGRAGISTALVVDGRVFVIDLSTSRVRAGKHGRLGLFSPSSRSRQYPGLHLSLIAHQGTAQGNGKGNAKGIDRGAALARTRS